VVQFARCGDPNGCTSNPAPRNISTPFWPQQTPAIPWTLVLDTTITQMPENFHENVCANGWYPEWKERWGWR